MQSAIDKLSSLDSAITTDFFYMGIQSIVDIVSN
jgi:hypothetical protein